MIVVLKHGVEAAKREQLIDWLKGQGLTIHISEGEYQTVLGLVGDTTRVDMDLIASLGIVDSVKRVTEPFKCCRTSTSCVSLASSASPSCSSAALPAPSRSCS